MTGDRTAAVLHRWQRQAVQHQQARQRVAAQDDDSWRASLRDLTDAMRINPSSLYNTIGDKHESFLRCVQRYMDYRKEYIAKHVSSKRSPWKTIEIFIDDAVASITRGPHSCMAIKAAFEVATDDVRVQAILKNDSDATYRLLCSLLTAPREGRDQRRRRS